MACRPLIALLAAASAFAAEGAPPAEPAAKPEPYFVDHVDGTRIFVKVFGTDDAVATDAKTVITLDGKAATLADLRKGDHLVHVLVENSKATRIEAMREPAAGDVPKK
jgi:hypothetical protein